MIFRFIALLLIVATMLLINHSSVFINDSSTVVPATFVLGFLLLSAYLFGYFGSKVKMPKITGYILAGIFFGPYFLNFLSKDSIKDLNFLNSLALAFIAFCAGGELHLDSIRERLKSIGFMLTGITFVVLTGVTIAVLSMSSYIPFMKDYPFATRLAIALLFGVISTARSPSSAIAIISEVKAKGVFTDIVLSVTIVMDVIVIVLFGIVMSFCQALITPDSTINLIMLFYIILEIFIAFILGFFLGKGLIFLIQTLGVELPIVVAAMGFVVIKFCHILSEQLNEIYNISVNLEPILICIAAGFTVQNFSKYGTKFLHSLDRISLPIYVAFFTITGATINIEILKTGWMVGLIIVFVRVITIYIGTNVSSKLAGDKPIIYKNAWMAFITQAGVSLGLVYEIVRRFPEIGISLQTILITSITINQIIGPISMKYILQKTGEARLYKR